MTSLLTLNSLVPTSVLSTSTIENGYQILGRNRLMNSTICLYTGFSIFGALRSAVGDAAAMSKLNTYCNQY